jgi:5'-deoxynucleotidase
MSSLSLEQKLRSGHVKRWQIVRVAREQTIAEHMYRVNVVANEIVERMGEEAVGIRPLVQQWALMHDIPEIVTGDIATPTKRAMRQAVPDADPVKHIELSLDQQYRSLYELLKSHFPQVLEIVKIADLIEAVDFLNIEGMGAHATSVNIGLRESILEKISSSDDENLSAAAMSVFEEICHSLENESAQDGPYPVTK